jgi:hypothetical protein
MLVDSGNSIVVGIFNFLAQMTGVEMVVTLVAIA